MDFKLDKLILLLPGNIWWKGLDGKFLGCNNNVVELLGLKTSQDIVGKTNHDIFEENLANELDETDRIVIAENREVETEELAFNENREPAYYITKKQPITDDDGKVIGILGVSIDISQRIKQEKELAIAKEKAEVANNAKSNFIMNISHDIRTPLNGVIGFSKIVEAKETDETKKECIGYIVQSSERLAEYLNEVISMITTKDQITLQHTKFNLSELIHKVGDMFIAESALKNIRIIYDVDSNLPVEIVSDSFRIEKILLNLVGNAFKFSNQGSVTISAKLLSSDQDKHKISLKVSDEGIGIDEKDQEQIFGQFNRLEPSYSNRYQGFGLGLYIVKSFVDDLQGTISVESELGKGATFEFVFDAPCLSSSER